jgi:hypothetical protein
MPIAHDLAGDLDEARVRLLQVVDGAADCHGSRTGDA